eukprot:9832413-Ditylum_brightwellii.AAC.1
MTNSLIPLLTERKTGTAFVAIALCEGLNNLCPKEATVVSMSLLLQYSFNFIAPPPQKATVLLSIANRKKDWNGLSHPPK